MAAPTFVAEYGDTWNSATSPKTASVTTAAGDVLVILSAVESNGATADLPTGGTGTYVNQENLTAANYGRARIDTAVAGITAQTFTLSQTSDSGSPWWGNTILRFSGSAGIGAAESANTTGAPSLGITTTQANSAICVIVVDWNAADGAARTWRTVNGQTPTAGNSQERTYFRDASHFTVYTAYYPDAGAAGAKTVGLSAPSGQQYVIAAVEVLGSAATNATPAPGAVAAVAAVGSPTVTAPRNATVTPSVVSAVAAVPAPTVSTATNLGIQTGYTSQTPDVPDAASPGGINVGNRVRFGRAGKVIGMRWFTPQSSVAPGAVFTLYNAAGTVLAQYTWAIGVALAQWVPVDFSSAVSVSTATDYYVAVWSPAGYTAGAAQFAGGPIVNGDVQLQGGYFDTGATPARPTSQFNDNGYYVDPRFVADADATSTSPAPTVVATTAAVPAPSVSGGTNTTPAPAVVTAVAAVPAPSLSTGSSTGVAPQTVVAVAAVGALAAAVASTVMPDAVAAAAAVGAPSISTAAGATLSPSVVAAIAAVAAPTVTGGAGATVTPAAVGAVVAVPAPVITVISGTTRPNVVAAVAFIPQPLILGAFSTGSRTLTDGMFSWYGARASGATLLDRMRNYYVSVSGLPAGRSVADHMRAYYAAQLGLSATQAAARGIVQLELAYWQSVDAGNNAGSWADRARRFYGA